MKILDLLESVFPSLEHPRVEFKISNSDISKLHPKNWARAIVTYIFLENTSNAGIVWDEINLALVGGSPNDPELKALLKFAKLKRVTYFGIESGEWLDLNEPPSGLYPKFDFVLCSQVLEHIWNHKNFFSNISQLVETGGHVWIAAPASNRPHGSPSYFSAGFTAEYLSLNLASSGFKIVSEGNIGTRRLYKSLHTMPTWLSYRAHRWPLLFGFDDLPKKYRYFYRLRYSIRLAELKINSGKITSSISTATEAWCLAKKY